MDDKPRSVYTRGAENGLLLGPLMAGTCLLLGLCAYHAWAVIPFAVLAFAVPAALYVMLGRAYREDRRASTLAALWLQGICGFFFGGLLMSLVVYAALRWAFPSFIYDQARMVVDLYGSMDNPDAREVARVMERAVRAHALPSPMEVALELLYFVVFTGSLLSVIFAAVIRRRGRRTPPPFNS